MIHWTFIQKFQKNQKKTTKGFGSKTLGGKAKRTEKMEFFIGGPKRNSTESGMPTDNQWT
jgi:hypothetical protein